MARTRFYLSRKREWYGDLARADRLKFTRLWQGYGEQCSAPPQLSNCRLELPAVE
jgi:hypothetical protein